MAETMALVLFLAFLVAVIALVGLFLNRPEATAAIQGLVRALGKALSHL